MFGAKNLLLAGQATALVQVAYDATGGGFGTASANTGNSWTHSATAGAYVVVAVSNAQFSSDGSVVTGVTYGGVAMTLLGSVNYPATAAGTDYLYGLANVASGSKTVAVSVSPSGLWSGNSCSYLNVTSVGTVVTAAGSTSQAMTCPTKAMVVHAFGAFNNSLSAPSGGTSRYTMNPSNGFGSLNISDAAASVTFGITASFPAYCCGIGVQLL